MLEKEFNKRIKDQVIKTGGWAFKIADPPKAVARSVVKNPFDGFGILGDGTPIYWEAKIESTPKAFSFTRIAPHQLESLASIRSLNPQTSTVIVLGMPLEGYRSVRVWLFDVGGIITRIKSGAKSVPLKELVGLPHWSISDLSDEVLRGGTK